MKKYIELIKQNYFKIIAYVITVALSLVVLMIGHNIAYDKSTLFLGGYDDGASKATVTKILYDESEDKYIDGQLVGTNYTVVFECKVTSGELKGQTVTASETATFYDAVQLQKVKVGDKILIAKTTEGISDYYMHDFDRSMPLWILGAAFVVLILVFGRLKGVNTIVSLGFTCLAVFTVFVPAVMSGQNVYLWSILTCAYIIIMTLLITNGFSSKTLAAIIGCVSGVFVAGGLTLLMSGVLKLTGFTTEEMIYVKQSFGIDLNALIFAGIILGAVGAVMDVAVSISSSLKELHDQVEAPTLKGLFKSGVTIGRDIMGTMANTLVLAYIGCELSATLLSVAYSSSMTTLFSREKIVAEVLQALVGSIGILLTIPLTAFVSAALYTRFKGNKSSSNKKKIQKNKYYIEPSDEPSLFERAKADTTESETKE